MLGEKTISLPEVFIGGKYIGGVDVQKQLHEAGELVKMQLPLVLLELAKMILTLLLELTIRIQFSWQYWIVTV